MSPALQQSSKVRHGFKPPGYALVQKRKGTSMKETSENESDEEHSRRMSSKKRRLEEEADETSSEGGSSSDDDDDDDSDECLPMSEAQINKLSRIDPSESEFDKNRIIKINLERDGLRKNAAHHTELRKVSTSGSNAPNGQSKPSSNRYFLCMWRSPQFRKHKTWDGDAYLILSSNGNRLVDTDKKNVLSTGFKMRSELHQGDILAAGSKEIEIEKQISRDEYYTGRAPEPAPAVKSRPMVKAKSSVPWKEANKQFKTPSKLPARGQREEVTDSSKKSRLSSKASASFDRYDPIPASRFYQRAPTEDERSDKVRPSGLFAEGDGDSPKPRYDPTEKGSIVMKRPNKAHGKIWNKKGSPIVDVVLDPVIARSLREHQVEGIKFLYERVTGLRMTDEDQSLGAILADDMGLGKTLQTIAVIDTLLTQNCYYTSKGRTIDRALVVCPVSVVKNWAREFKKWTGEKIKVQCLTNENKVESTVNGKYQVLIIGYDKLLKVKKQVADVQPKFGLLICDEAHRLKNLNSKTFKMLNDLNIERCILLSGTPIQNNLSEFHAMCDMVAPKMLGVKKTFKELFETPILKSRMPHCTKAEAKLGKERGKYLQQVTQSLLLRRTADILTDFLPPKYEQVVFCSPTKKQIELYQKLIDSERFRAIVDGSSGNQSFALNGIGLLRKLCNSPELLLSTLASKSKEEICSITKKLLIGMREDMPEKLNNDFNHSGKMICVVKMLQYIRENTSDKVVLVSNFTATLDILEAICRKQRYSFVRLDGNTKAAERSIIINNFNTSTQESHFIFLLSSKAGGVGVNLIGANRLILFDSDWNPATDRQAMARIHRDGQKKTCYIYRMLIPGTMDEKIYQRQTSKLSLSDAMVENEGKSGKNTESFTPEMLRDIFKLHIDTPCVSHDQMKCSCEGNGIEGAGSDGDTSDSEVELESSEEDSDGDRGKLSMPKNAPHAGFVKASQVHMDQENAIEKQAEIKLAALLKWAHHDCTKEAFELTKDEVINAIVSEQHEKGNFDSYDEEDFQFDMKKVQPGSILYIYAQMKRKKDKIVELEEENDALEEDSEETEESNEESEGTDEE